MDIGFINVRSHDKVIGRSLHILKLINATDVRIDFNRIIYEIVSQD